MSDSIRRDRQLAGRRRVVIVAPVLARYDAISASVLDMARSLTAMRGIDVRIITLRSDSPEIPEIALVSGLPEMLLNADFLAADLIVYHFGIYSPLFDAISVGNGRAKQVVVFHNITPVDLAHDATRSLLERSFTQLDSMNPVDEFWADSQENADLLISRGFDASAVRIIPIVVEGIPRKPLTAKTSETIQVLYVGRFVASKGVRDLLIAALSVVASGETGFHVTLAGNLEWSDTAYVTELRRDVTTWGLEDRVRFLGTVTDVELVNLYHESHILAMPSYHEGFCKPVIEALRAGCVPIYYTSGNLRRIAGGLGKGVDPGDLAGFSEALLGAIEEVRSIVNTRSGSGLMLDSGSLTGDEFTARSLEHTSVFESGQVGRLVRSAAARLLPKSAPAGPISSDAPDARIGRLSVHNTNVTVLSGLETRRSDRASLNRLPDMSDWRLGSRFVEVLGELNQPAVIHRKAWEYALCIQGFEALGLVTPTARALGVGAGYESPLFYFANRVEKVVATDLYDNPDHEGKPAMLTTPWQFAPFEYQRERLEVRAMSGDDLQYPDSYFDFAFCLSSIEHFGSRATQRASLAEMKRVLRPGGVACVITELILDGAPHHEYFMPEELDEMFLCDPDFYLVGGDLLWEVACESVELAVDIRIDGDLQTSPHLVLDDGERRWTSASLFLQKR